MPVSLEPLKAPTPPSYPARLPRRRGMRGLARTLGAALAATAALLSAPARADDEWMFWLDDMDFCPLMDCGPSPPPIGVRPYRLAGVTMVGTLSAPTIRLRVREQSNRVRACYERRLQHDPGLAGRVAVTFVIQRDGTVGATTIAESTLADRELETCVRDVVSSITFPVAESDGRYVVTYPFLFQPRQTPSQDRTTSPSSTP